MTGTVTVLQLRFTSNRHCYVALPRSFKPINEEIYSLEVLTNGTPLKYVHWSGEYCRRDGTIEINSVFALQLGLHDGDQVIVSRHEARAPTCRRCTIEPLTENDFELLTANTGAVESCLMNQIRCVWNDLVLPIWVSPTTNVCLLLRVIALVPDKVDCVVLEENTELVVAPPGTAAAVEAARRQSGQTMPKVPWLSNLTNLFNRSSNSDAIDSTSEAGSDHVPQADRMQSVGSQSRYIPLRVLPYAFGAADNRGEADSQIWNTVVVNPCEHRLPPASTAIAQLNVILSPTQRKANAIAASANKTAEDVKKSKFDTNFISTPVAVLNDSRCPPGSILVCDSLRRQLGLAISSRVYLTMTDHEEVTKRSGHLSDPDDDLPVNTRVKIPESTILRIRPLVPTKKPSELLAKALTQYLRNRALICGHGTLIILGGEDFFVDAPDKETRMGFMIRKKFADDTLETSVILGDPLGSLLKSPWNELLPYKTLKELDSKVSLSTSPISSAPLAGFEQVYEELSGNVKTFLTCESSNQPRHPYRSSMLICGATGSGKRTLLKKLTAELKSDPQFVYVQEIDCKMMRGKRVDSLYKELLLAIAECYHRQPALLVLHDLDVLVPAPQKPEEEIGVEALYYNRLARLLMSLFKLVEHSPPLITDDKRGDEAPGPLSPPTTSRLVLVATCKALKNIHQTLVEVKGRHFFNHIIQLSRLSPEQRRSILVQHLKDRPIVCAQSIQHLALDDLVRRTDGYLPLDLGQLVDKALHHCWQRLNRHKTPGSAPDEDVQLALKTEDFDRALLSFTPHSLRGVSLRTKSTKTFAQVGALDSIKQVLLQTILWPSKYPDLYQRCPLRPASCILLYGPPGTGKTLLVEALANECDLNFISVEGPELLSKYIGASEQAVRDLFLRASAARPCILFFDEFDSIAPRRGHDSTGVTDRIVNQLLTQMDGVEGLEQGIFILAATSRPDLLDPALLRSGRFDKCLHCPLPDQQSRLQILKALTKRLALAPDVDLLVVAQRTEHFTGADLQSVLYSAQIEALHQKLERTRVDKENAPKSTDDQDQHQEDDDCADCQPWSVGSSAVDTSSGRSSANSEPQQLSDTNKSHDSNDKNASQQRLSHDYGGGDRRTGGLNGIVEIGWEHIRAALNNAKPSLSASERKKYEAIANFTQPPQTDQPRRVTLA